MTTDYSIASGRHDSRGPRIKQAGAHHSQAAIAVIPPRPGSLTTSHLAPADLVNEALCEVWLREALPLLPKLLPLLLCHRDKVRVDLQQIRASDSSQFSSAQQTSTPVTDKSTAKLLSLHRTPGAAPSG